MSVQKCDVQYKKELEEIEERYRKEIVRLDFQIRKLKLMLKKDKMTADELNKKPELHEVMGLSAPRSSQINDDEVPDPFGYFKRKIQKETEWLKRENSQLKHQTDQEHLDLEKHFIEEKLKLTRKASEEKEALKRQASEEKKALKRQAAKEKSELKKQADLLKIQVYRERLVLNNKYQNVLQRKVSLGLGQLNPKKKTIFSRVKRALGLTNGTPKQ